MLSIINQRSLGTSVREDYADLENTVEATGVYFIMCHDGANVSSISMNAQTSESEDKAQPEVETKETSRKTKFRAMIYTLIDWGYNVALINGLEFIDTKVSLAE